MKIWTCTTDGDDMPIETTVHATFESAAEPCRVALREMEWESRHGDQIETADQIAAAWDETFGGHCIIVEHDLAV